MVFSHFLIFIAIFALNEAIVFLYNAMPIFKRWKHLGRLYFLNCKSCVVHWAQKLPFGRQFLRHLYLNISRFPSLVHITFRRLYFLSVKINFLLYTWIQFRWRLTSRIYFWGLLHKVKRHLLKLILKPSKDIRLRVLRWEQPTLSIIVMQRCTFAHFEISMDSMYIYNIIINLK